MKRAKAGQRTALDSNGPAKRSIVQQPNLESVGYLCRRVMAANLRDLQVNLPDLDVTMGHLGTLVLIACNPGISPTEICRAQGFEKPTITASLDKLERKSLIVRKASRTDRRSFALFLTKRGKAFYDELILRVRESERRLTKSLTEEERTKLIGLLLRIYNSECSNGADYSIQTKVLQKIPLRSAQMSRKLLQAGNQRNNTTPSGPIQIKTPADVSRYLKEVEHFCAHLRMALGRMRQRRP